MGLILERDGVARLPHQPVTDVVADPDGLGYYPAADGGVFDVTDQPFHGSASRLADTPIVAITPTV